MSNLSYLSFSMEGMMQAVYGFNREALICPEEEVYCLYTNPAELLQDIGMNKLPYWADVGWIAFNVVLFRTLAYCSLRFKVQNL